MPLYPRSVTSQRTCPNFLLFHLGLTFESIEKVGSASPLPLSFFMPCLFLLPSPSLHLLPLLFSPSFQRACPTTLLFLSFFLPYLFYWHTHTFFISLFFVLLQCTPLILFSTLPILSHVHTHIFFPFFVLLVLPHIHIISIFPYFYLFLFFYHVTTHTFPFFLFLPYLSSHTHTHTFSCLPLFIPFTFFHVATHTHLLFFMNTKRTKTKNKNLLIVC